MPPRTQISCFSVTSSKSPTPSTTCGAQVLKAMAVSHSVSALTTPSPSPPYTCFNSDIKRGGSFGFYIHNILILYFILSVIPTDDQKGTTTQATSSITWSIMLL